MRNQTWTQDGKLVRDIELYLDGEILKARDHLTDEIRDATEEEKEQFFYKPLDLAGEIARLKARVEDLEKARLAG